MKKKSLKIFAVLLSALLVASLGTSSFALLDKYDDDSVYELTTEQKRLLDKLETSAREDAIITGNYGSFEDKLYNRDFDKNVNTAQKITPKETKATAAKVNTNAATVEKYFKKYYSSQLAVTGTEGDNTTNATEIANIYGSANWFSYAYNAANNEFVPFTSAGKPNSKNPVIFHDTGDFFSVAKEENIYIIVSKGPLVKK